MLVIVFKKAFAR